MRFTLLKYFIGSFLASILSIPVVAQEIISPTIEDSARIMTGFTGAAVPVHLGGDGAISGGAQGGGASMNDTGDTLVGDGGGNQGFGLVLMFDTTENARAILDSGEYTVRLHGKTLKSVTNELEEVVDKTTGEITWSPIVVSRQGYGNSTTGTFGDNQFLTAAAWNLDGESDTVTNATYSYEASTHYIPNNEAVLAQDVGFVVDITDLVDPEMLTVDNDRLVIAISAIDPNADPIEYTNADGVNDRIAFYASEFAIEILPTPPTVIPATIEDSARIMSAFSGSDLPVHLGGNGGIFGGAQGGGVAMNDTGDTLVGDGGANQAFGLVLMFDTNTAVRDIIDSGEYTVKLHGKTLKSVTNELEEVVDKTIGEIDWSPIVVSRQGYGNSTNGTFGSNQFLTAAAWNLDGVSDTLTNAAYDYEAAVVNIPNHDAVRSQDVDFSVDITDLIDQGMLTVDNDRLVIALSAIDPSADPIVYTDANSDDDRVAFYASEFAIEVLPTPQTVVPATLEDSARIMTGFTGGAVPAHLGGDGAISGGAQGGGASMNDNGDAIVGDGGGNQGFGLVLMFDTNPTFRSVIESGEYTVKLHGKTLKSVTNDLDEVVDKTVGEIDWSPIVVSRQGYGNSTNGSFGSNQFLTAAAWNLDSESDTVTAAAYDYEAARVNIPYNDAVIAEDVEFSVDITDLIESGMLTMDNDRLVLALSAIDPSADPIAYTDGASDNDRVAFYASEFAIEVLPTPQNVIPATIEDSARIMSAFSGSDLPVHLGGNGGIFGGAQGGGASMNDSGDAIVGDGGANQAFGLVLMFDSNPAVRDMIESGTYSVFLRGKTLKSVTDELDEVVDKTVGEIDWSPIVVSRQGYGSSTSGSFGSNQFLTAAAWNLDGVNDTVADATYSYEASANTVPNNEAVRTADTAFEVEITDLVDVGMLSDDSDRLVLALSAIDPTADPIEYTNGNSANDRVAFYASEFEVVVLPYAATEVPANIGDSARIMSAFSGSDLPVHLGGNGGIFGGAQGGGASMNDSGDAIVGDGGANQAFGLILMFDTNASFRDVIDTGDYRVWLDGSTLFSYTDELDVTSEKTVGNIDWSPIVVSRQGYGSSETGVFGDNQFLTAAAWNLDGGDNVENGVFDYAASAQNIPNDDDVRSMDVPFSVDITDIVDQGLLSVNYDRLALAISAIDPSADPIVYTDAGSDNDRVAFYASEFVLRAEVIERWAGFEVIDASVSTGSLLGDLDLSLGDWVYSSGMAQYLYLPEANYLETVAWVFMPVDGFSATSWSDFTEVTTDYYRTFDFLGLVYDAGNGYVYSFGLGAYVYVDVAGFASGGAWVGILQ